MNIIAVKNTLDLIFRFSYLISNDFIKKITRGNIIIKLKYFKYKISTPNLIK